MHTSRAFLIATMALVLWSCGSRPAAPVSFVHDLEGDLAYHENHALDSLFRAHEERTGNEIVLVTTPTFQGKKAVEFAVQFGDSLGVGKKDRDNGMVIAYSSTERQVFITTGYGTERVLHDSICKRFVDELMLPRFKEGKLFDGLWAGSRAVVEFLEQPGNEIR